MQNLTRSDRDSDFQQLQTDADRVERRLGGSFGARVRQVEGGLYSVGGRELQRWALIRPRVFALRPQPQ